MAAMTIFHCRQTDSFLSRTNPLAKLIALISYSVLISMTDCWLSLFLSTIPFVIVITIKIPLKEYIKESIFFILIAVVMFIAEFFNTEDGLSALSASASFLSIVAASMILMDTTMPDDLSRSLGSALSHVAGHYAYSVATVIEITMAMIPVITDSVVSLYEARIARGERFILHPFRSLCQLAQCILSDLLDKAEIYIDALYSRGYDAAMRRECAPYRLSDWVIIAACPVFVFTVFVFENNLLA